MKGNKDKEYIELRNRFLLGLFGCIVVGTLILLIIFRKYVFGGIVTRKMLKEDSFVVLITKNDCSNCDKIKNFLDSQNVIYEELDENSNDAINIFEDYEFNMEEDISPAVLYISNGKLYSSLVNINTTDELKLFIQNYKLSSK